MRQRTQTVDQTRGSVWAQRQKRKGEGDPLMLRAAGAMKTMHQSREGGRYRNKRVESSGDERETETGWEENDKEQRAQAQLM